MNECLCRFSCFSEHPPAPRFPLQCESLFPFSRLTSFITSTPTTSVGSQARATTRPWCVALKLKLLKRRCAHASRAELLPSLPAAAALSSTPPSPARADAAATFPELDDEGSKPRNGFFSFVRPMVKCESLMPNA